MSKVLYITANPKPAEAAYSLQVSDAFVEAYKAQNPQDEVVTLNLYQSDVDFLSLANIQTLFSQDKSNMENDPLLKYVHQFKSADKYIFSFPMWNFGVPAILKAYIDYVSVVGVTFKYTETGVMGLLENKKAMLVTSRGGSYSQAPMAQFEFAANYMQAILGLFGIQDVQTLAVENATIQGVDVAAVVKDVTEQAVTAAKSF